MPINAENILDIPVGAKLNEPFVILQPKVPATYAYLKIGVLVSFIILTVVSYSQAKEFRDLSIFQFIPYIILNPLIWFLGTLIYLVYRQFLKPSQNKLPQTFPFVKIDENKIQFYSNTSEILFENRLENIKKIGLISKSRSSNFYVMSNNKLPFVIEHPSHYLYLSIENQLFNSNKFATEYFINYVMQQFKNRQPLTCNKRDFLSKY